MSRNGSGTYSLPAGNPVVTGTTISSTWANNTLSDIATALTQSIAYDGQTTPTANLPMGGFKHTGVAVGAALTDYARYDQMQNSAAQWLTGVTGTDTITASAAVTPAAYAAGQVFRFISAGSNTTTSVTLNISSLGAKNITKNGATALAIGDIPASAAVEVMYDGTQFKLIGTAVNTAVSATTSTNLASGALGSIPYQSAASTTAFVAGTTSTTPGMLTSIGTGAAAQGPSLKTLTEIQALTSGQVLQKLTFTDAGGTTTSTTLANVTGSVKTITPKSTTSTILIRATYQGSISAVAATNTYADYRLYEGTVATPIGVLVQLGISNGAGSNTLSVPITIVATVSNTALTARTFGLGALSSIGTATASGTGIVFEIEEIQN